MNATAHTVNESDGTTHGIDEDRYVRAVRETMTVTELGPATYEVAHEGETYGVDLDGIHCTCPDHEYRDARCKHLVRAALFAAFTNGVRTRFTAAVVRAADDFGCVDGHADCAGPTGDTLPCQTCIHGTGTGEWTVWAVLVGGRPAREVTPDATVDRGEGTRDQDKIKAKTKGATLEDAREDMDQLKPWLRALAEDVREWQPGDDGDGG